MSYKLTNDHINTFKELLKTFDNLDSLIEKINLLKGKQDSRLDGEIRKLRGEINVEKESLMDQLTHDDKIYFQMVFRWGDEMKKIKTDRLRGRITSGSYTEREDLKKFKNTELPTLANLTEEKANQTPDFVSTEDKPSLLDEEKDRHASVKGRILSIREVKKREKRQEKEKNKHRENLKKLMMPTLRREEEGGRRTRRKLRAKSRKRSKSRKRRRKRRRSKSRKRYRKKRTKRRR